MKTWLNKSILIAILSVILVACGAADWPAAPDISDVQTICLEIDRAMSENETDWIFNDEDITRILGRLDYEWVEAGGACDATLAFTGKGKAYGGSYSSGSGAGASSSYCYTGGSVKGAVTLTLAGQEPVDLPIRGSMPRQQTTTDCYSVPPYYLVIHVPMLDALTHFFGADFLVRSIVDSKSYIRDFAVQGVQNLETGAGPAFLDCLWGPDVRVADFCAKYVGSYNDPAEVVPVLLERLAEDNVQSRAIAAAALGYIGPSALQSVPFLIPLLEDGREVAQGSFVSDYALEALQAITGQDLGAQPEAWQQWWQAQ